MVHRDDLPRSAPASGGRDAKAVVGFGDSADHPGTLGPLLACYHIGPPANGVECADCPAGTMVPQTSPDLLRCACAGAQGVVGPGADFSRVACRNRHGKSSTRTCGTTNRRGLLCSLMAKVDTRFLVQNVMVNLKIECLGRGQSPRGSARYQWQRTQAVLRRREPERPSPLATARQGP